MMNKPLPVAPVRGLRTRLAVLMLASLALGVGLVPNPASAGAPSSNRATRLTPAPQSTPGSTFGEEEPCEVAVVRHAPKISGTVDGTIRQLLPESVNLGGSATILGDLLIPGLPTVKVNGSPAYQGTIDDTGADTPTNHKVAISGQTQLRHVVRRVDAIAMPTVDSPDAPTGTLDLHFTEPGQSVSDWADVRNLTLSGMADIVAVPPGSYGSFRANSGTGFVLGVEGATEPSEYSFQELTFGGHGVLQVAGPVIVTLGSGLTLNASAGDHENPEWLQLNVASGDVTLNGGSQLTGIVTAPNGAVVIHGNSILCGRVTADRLTVVGEGVLVCCAGDPGDPPDPPPPTIVIPFQSVWRYKVFPHDGEPAGWQAVNFDDSTWDIGGAAFASGGNCGLQSTKVTDWPIVTDIVIRKTFELPAGVHTLRISGSVDNDVQIYLNGFLVTDWVTHEGCPQYDDFMFLAPAGSWNEGTNLIAIRARDRHTESFLDFQVSFND